MKTKNIKYPYLPKDRVVLYVREDNPYMQEAKKIALTQSTDKKISTGVVIVDDNGDILVSAANQSALKNKFLLNTHKNWCVRKPFKIPSGQKYWLCPGCASSRNHAESLAMKKAEKLKINVSGYDVYLWGHWWCCEPCWDKMIQAEIRNVYLIEDSHKIFR